MRLCGGTLPFQLPSMTRRSGLATPIRLRQLFPTDPWNRPDFDEERMPTANNKSSRATENTTVARTEKRSLFFQDRT